MNKNLVRPYGDTIGDGKIQLSFTLPLPNDERSREAAKVLARKMGFIDPYVAHSGYLDKDFTFYVVYGSVAHDVDIDSIVVQSVQGSSMEMEEVSEYIREHIGRKVIVVGASTGTDAHTVGIDAIMNMKGYAGRYGLERYEMIEAHNMGSQVPNEDLIKRAIELNADVLLVSQTVTQKDVHIANMTELVEMLEAEGMRHKVILICGGTRITNELAKELGYDAGFGVKTYANDVASFFVREMANRQVTQ